MPGGSPQGGSLSCRTAGQSSLCFPYADGPASVWRPDGGRRDPASNIAVEALMADFLYLALGLGAFALFGLYAALLRKV